MWEIIGKVVLCFFAIVGLVEFCKVLIAGILYRSKPDPKAAIVLTVEGHNESVEQQIRDLAENIRWDKNYPAQKLICVDNGMDEETFEICDRLSREYSFFILTVPENLMYYL